MEPAQYSLIFIFPGIDMMRRTKREREREWRIKGTASPPPTFKEAASVRAVIAREGGEKK